MNGDRYAAIAASMRRMGWLQDRILYRARTRVVEMMVESGARTVLDACCGAGTLSRYLDAAAMAVLAVDASPAMLQVARERSTGPRWTQAEISRLLLREPVDGAAIALTLHEMSEPQRLTVWRTLQRLTRPGGVCVLMDYTPPPRKTFASQIAAWVIRQDERMVDQDDPGHYRNYLDFMNRGGARGWLEATDVPIVDEDYFLYGNLGVFKTEAAPDCQRSTWTLREQRARR